MTITTKDTNAAELLAAVRARMRAMGSGSAEFRTLAELERDILAAVHAPENGRTAGVDSRGYKEY